MNWVLHEQIENVRRILEGFWEFACPVFRLDLEKACDCVPLVYLVEGAAGIWGSGSLLRANNILTNMSSTWCRCLTLARVPRH